MSRREYRVNVYRTYFREDEITDGDYHDAPNTHTVADHMIGTASDLARWIRADGLTFAATGGEWAADPDGSYITDYATGERCETSAHFTDDIPDRLANAIRASVDSAVTS
jgi:hypothetical protein